MKAAQYPNMKICPERHIQLKKLGAAMGTRSIAGTVGELIAAEIERGTIPDEIPGIEIRGDGERVWITIADQAPKGLTIRHANALADSVDALAAVGGGGTDIHPSGGFQAQRQGGGVSVQLDVTAPDTKVFPVDLARDFTRLVRQATT